MGIKLSFREREESLVLSFPDFREEIMAGLTKVFGPDFVIAERDVVKNNGVTLYGISITGPDDNVSPAIYLESLYDEYEKGKINLREAENEILKVYSGGRSGTDQDMSYITDFEKVKDKLIFRLVNAELNSSLLNEIPHRKFLDLAIIYTIFVDGIFDTPGNIIVKNDLLEKWGCDEEELYKVSLENTPRIKEPVLRELSDMVLEIVGADEKAREEMNDPGLFKMFVLTNSDKFYGDSPILYPGFLKEVSKNSGSDLYLLPSSVHEFIVIPDNGKIDPDELKELVMSVNRTTVSKEEFLSDSVYVFRDDEISICA